MLLETEVAVLVCGPLCPQESFPVWNVLGECLVTGNSFLGHSPFPSLPTKVLSVLICFRFFKAITDVLANITSYLSLWSFVGHLLHVWGAPEDRKLTNTLFSAESHGFLGKRLHPLLPNPSQRQALGSSSWRCVQLADAWHVTLFPWAGGSKGPSESFGTWVMFGFSLVRPHF